MTLRVRRLTGVVSVQDLGRRGFRSSGVPVSGAADPLLLRLANVCVGNAHNDAGLELAGGGLTFDVTSDVIVCLQGTAHGLVVDGRVVPANRPLWIEQGCAVEVRATGQGARSWLCIGGGLQTPVVLGSRSTYLAGGFGGLDGRLLRRGDTLAVGQPSAITLARSQALRLRARGAKWAVPAWWLPLPWSSNDVHSRDVASALSPVEPFTRLRIIPSAELSTLEPAAVDALLTNVFTVSRDANRVGCRLFGAPLPLRSATPRLSTPTTPGTVQVLPNGQLVILLVDGGTTGGYPSPCTVAEADWPRLAQLVPGNQVRFAFAGSAMASRWRREQERALRALALISSFWEVR